MLNIMLHYAKLCSINCKKLPMFSAMPTYNIIIVICFLSEYLINYRANYYLICGFNAISGTALLE